MDIDQLAVLRELADRGSIVDVAAAIHKSPSAVSQQLRTLQRQVGVVLVERVGRGVRLTDAGRALAESSVRIATAVAEAEATWSAFQGGATGEVSVAFFPSAAELLVPGLLSRMAAHEGIELVVAERDVSQNDFAELAADFDIVVSHRSDDARVESRLTVVPLLREPLDVALPLDHPLAASTSLQIEQVIGERWIGVEQDFPIDRVLQAMAARAGVAANVIYRSIHLPLIENLVAAGHGIALMPRHTSADRARGRLVLVPITDMKAGREVEALMRPDRAARRAVQTVLAELRAEADGIVSRIGNIDALG